MGEQETDTETTRPEYSDGAREYFRGLTTLPSGMMGTDWVILVLTLLSVATVGLWFVGWLGVGLVLGTGITVGISTVAAGAKSPIAHGISGLFAFLGAVFVSGVAAVTVALLTPSSVLGVIGGLGMYCLVLAVVGAILVPFGRPGTDFSRPLGTTLSVASGVLLVFLAASVPQAESRRTVLGLVSEILGIVYGLALSPEPEHTVVTFFSLIAVAAVALSAGLSRIPVGTLLPPDRVGYWESKVGEASGYLFGAFVLSAVCGVLASVLTFFPIGGNITHPDVVGELPVGGVLVAVMSNVGVRGVFALLSVVGVVTVLSIRSLGLFRGGFVASFFISKLPVGVGAVLGVLTGAVISGIGVRRRLLSAVSSFTPEGVILSFRELSSFGLANLSFLFMLVLLIPLLVLFEATRILFARSGNTGPTLVSVGLFGFGIAAILADIFLGGLVVAAVGLFVWDVGGFSREIRESLPSGARVSRVESVHTAGSAIVISISTVVAYVLYTVVTPLVAPGEPGVAAVGLTVITLVTLPVVYVLRTEG